MKFRKAINVYVGDTIQRLIDGVLVLQPGQWIKCGEGPCSRWCGVTTTGTVIAAHPRGKRGVTQKDFKLSLEHWKGRRAKR
jgi:hypothetical protein